nr:hypothetical protein [Posidoniimonas polymericola]
MTGPLTRCVRLAPIAMMRHSLQSSRMIAADNSSGSASEPTSSIGPVVRQSPWPTRPY